MKNHGDFHHVNHSSIIMFVIYKLVIFPVRYGKSHMEILLWTKIDVGKPHGFLWENDLFLFFPHLGMLHHASSSRRSKQQATGIMDQQGNVWNQYLSWSLPKLQYLQSVGEGTTVFEHATRYINTFYAMPFRIDCQWVVTRWDHHISESTHIILPSTQVWFSKNPTYAGETQHLLMTSHVREKIIPP